MLHIVINPAAGHGRANRVGTKILSWLQDNDIAFTSSHTETVGHATELAQEAVKNGAKTVIAVGGDGTVCETARGLFGTNAALGIIPAGTGNDIIKMLGTPRKPMEALAFILDHPARKLDAGYVNDTLFLNVCGTGFDVCVLDHALVAKKYVRGMLPYLWGVIRTIFTFRPVEATFEVDGEAPYAKRLLLLAVANGRFIGGGMNVAPKAEPDDGLLDLITIDSMPNWRMPFQIPRLLSGRILDIPGVQCRKCRRVTLSSRRMRINLDGEIIPLEKASFHIMPEALRVHW